MAEKITQTSSNKGYQELDEADLVSDAKGNPESFGKIYYLYIQPIFRYLYSRIGSRPEAEDATAQTFLAALEGLNHYHHKGHFAAWLFAIARRKAMDHFRSLRSDVSLENAENITLDTEPDLLQQVIQTEQNSTLVNLISTLPEEERELIRLRYIAELSFSEIAQLMNRNEDAVKKSLYRLLDRLQSQLEVSHE